MVSLQHNALKCFENHFRVEDTVKQMVRVIKESCYEKNL